MEGGAPPTKEKPSLSITMVRNKFLMATSLTRYYWSDQLDSRKMNFQITNVNCDNEFSSSSETEISPLHHKFDIELHIRMFLKN